MASRTLSFAFYLAGALALTGCKTTELITSGSSDGRPIDRLSAAQSTSGKAQPTEKQLLRFAMLQPSGVAEVPVVSEYARDVLRKLLEGVPGPRPATQVYLIPSSNFNAETGPSGGIFLTFGTLERLRTDANLGAEDHLAFILAHELAHVLLGHVEDRADSRDALRKLSILAQIGMQVAGAKAQDATKQRLGGYVLANVLGLEALETTLFPAWTRDQEYDADRLGIDLMVKAGYLPDAAFDVINVINADEQERDRRRKAAKEALEKQLEEQRKIMPVKEAINAASASLQQQMEMSFKQVLEDLRNNHPGSDNRDDALRTYVMKEYADVRPKMRKDPLQRVLNRSEVKLSLQRFRSLEQALQLIDAKNPQHAQSAYRIGAQGPTGQTPYAAWVGYRVAVAAGRPDDGIPVLTKAISHPQATLPVYMALGEYLEAHGRNDIAYATYRTADERLAFDDLIPHEIRVAKRLNRSPDVSGFQVRCVATGDRDLIKRCSEAGK
ncbi:hypothetical protein TSH7_25330 [Azospirillum sp. TSH7]|uniref:M48 family metallopeptidase n=1 Tax=unclassified Azospirillum TaxID=2630922 RepID=UPI000D6129EB|nr:MULTISPECIES: M48 family metallopeptidase [unclassified Azospirillum]PWC57678.1 hypothetical protein TSH7_25330 [Azospirillum sp. TSH7]PWC64442.1 hypothetical protein TSH20_18380 [Azospirillum sp. TSH20]